MKQTIKSFGKNFVTTSSFNTSRFTARFGMLENIVLTIGLSLIYAYCSQIIITIPGYPVPISLQPLPIFLAAILLGWPAVAASVLYLVAGGCGLPIFAWGLGGVSRLVGPTGGYIFGFVFGSGIIAALGKIKRSSTIATFAKLLAGQTIVFVCGLLWLSNFVPSSSLLSLGLYPFIFGGLLKIVAICLLVKADRFFKTC